MSPDSGSPIASASRPGTFSPTRCPAPTCSSWATSFTTGIWTRSACSYRRLTTRCLRGALIVYEAIIDDDRRENAFGLLMSLNMLIEGLGFDYTGADCRGWMAGEGLR